MRNDNHPLSRPILAGSAAVVALLTGVLILWSPWDSVSGKASVASQGHSDLKLVVQPSPKSGPKKVNFNRDIRPILTENCYACHGPDLHAVEADLSLHSFEQATRLLYEDEGIAAIVPGDAEGSLAWERIIDRASPMPPKDSHKKLTDKQKQLIKQWIEEGAEYQPHWAYVAPEMSATPKVKTQDWPEHWIDNYVLAQLEAKQLTPTEDADRVSLIRRLTFDLTGLPPTSAEVDAFVNDNSPNAFEKVVDRLLSSPHYGERMAMYWLDVVRYADTVGYHGDQTQSITPYRDWVIWAFNQNMSYDQFMKHQIAGDLVDDPTGNALIASAYNRLYQTSHEGGIQRKEYAAIYDADRVRNFGEAFMGATIGCAQCHDHKYDPYTDEDFYALAAFFGQIDDLWHLPGDDGRFSKAGNTNPTNRQPEAEVITPLDQERKAELERQLKASADPAERIDLQKQIDSIKPCKVMVSKQLAPDQYRPVRFLARGDWLDESGVVMRPAVPSFMGELESRRDTVPTRLDLAKWLVTPMDQDGTAELNARVMVNRLWYLVYGEGLCTTLGDFGGQGMPPNHPELLDRLSLAFMASDWDVKAMMKTLVMTRTYRLSSEPSSEMLRVDPNNEFFARQSQRRLPAEMVRDNALMISGLLNTQLGGEAARPYQPKGYYKHLNFPTRRYQPHTTADQWRRGVYVHWQRQFLHPMLQAFDAPTREECTAKRATSNTPLAALVLLNDPTYVEASRSFAQRILTESEGSDRQRLDWAFREALSRSATDREAALILSLLEENRIAFKSAPARSDQLLAVGLSKPDQALDKTELASWAEVCRVILNLHETITRP